MNGGFRIWDLAKNSENMLKLENVLMLSLPGKGCVQSYENKPGAPRTSTSAKRHVF
jgi:hypothetical protein